jgi:hypothetical protein
MLDSEVNEEFCRELLSLLDKQLEVLEMSACVPLTDEEQREFEIRKQRIRELFEKLYNRRSAKGQGQAA